MPRRAERATDLQRQWDRDDKVEKAYGWGKEQPSGGARQSARRRPGPAAWRRPQPRPWPRRSWGVPPCSLRPSLPPAAAPPPGRRGEPGVRDVLREVNQSWGACLGLYVHGSTIFMNKEPQDVDLLAVVNPYRHMLFGNSSSRPPFRLGRYEVSVYTRAEWRSKQIGMDLTILTCSSLPERFVLYESLAKLREVRIRPTVLFQSIVAYAEFTWAKAQFVLNSMGDFYKASKNVYYVFRVLEFGGQLAECGRITDFLAANSWWTRIERFFADLQIVRGDWDVVEAAFASCFRQELKRFSQRMQLCLSSGLPPVILERPRLCEAVSGFLVGTVNCPPPAAPAPGPPETCGLCTAALGAEEETATLVRCGHRFHAKCAAECLRRDRRAEKTCCWTCQKALRPEVAQDDAFTRAKERLPPGFVVPPGFGGYPATLQPNDGAEGRPVGALFLVAEWLA